MIEDDIDEALHALEFGPTVPDGQAKVSRARNALNALRVQAREADMLRAKCADIEAHHISNLADQVRVLKAEVERLRAFKALADEQYQIIQDLKTLDPELLHEFEKDWLSRYADLTKEGGA